MVMTRIRVARFILRAARSIVDIIAPEISKGA